MFRVLEDINTKNADAMHTAGEVMKIGMGVVKKSNKEVEFPTAATAENIFFVTKEIVPTGIDSLKGEISDYNFEEISDGEMVVLVKPIIGEVYWTNQSGAVEEGDYVVVDTDGKFKKAVKDNKSNLKVTSIGIKDAGIHTGITIEVVDWTTIA